MEVDSDAAVISASLDDPGRFGTLFDRHATVLFRYLVRRVGVDEADTLLGEIFRVAFEKRVDLRLRADRMPDRGSTASRRTCSRVTAAARRGGSTRRRGSLARPAPDRDPADADRRRSRRRGDLWPQVADAVAGAARGGA